MKSFKDVINEAAVAIEDFMSKVSSCSTVQGIKELEDYYVKRVKEVKISSSDDIHIRDALSGKRKELESADKDNEEKF